MANVVRMGIVGFGNQGTNYAGLITGVSVRPRPNRPGAPSGPQVPNMVLAAICDVDPAKRELAKKVFPDIPVYEDYKEMILSGNVDAVVTTLPHYFHPDVVIFALEHGVHALSDKPAGVYVKQVKAMNACADAHPELTFGMMFNQRTNPLYIKIHDLVQSGEMGKLRRANWLITTWYRKQAYYNSSDWRATWGGEGGGVLVNRAPHQIDLMQWICGMPKRVFSINTNGYQRAIATEDDANAVFDYGDGATGVFITCTHDFLGTDRFEILLDGGKIIVDGSRTARVTRLQMTEQEINKEEGNAMGARLAMMSPEQRAHFIKSEETIEFTREELAKTGHAKVLRDFAGHILEGTPMVARGQDGINGVMIANAIQLSSWLGQPVDLPVDEELYLSELNNRIAAEGKYPQRS